MEKIKLPKDIGQGKQFTLNSTENLYDGSHSPDHIPIGAIFVNKFKSIPCVIRIEHTYNEELIFFLRKNAELVGDSLFLANNQPKTVVYDYYDIEDDETNDFRGVFLYKDSFIKFDQVRSKKALIRNKDKKNKKLFTVTCYYKVGTVPPLEDFEKFRIEEKLKNVIHTIFRDEHGSVTFEPFETVVPEKFNIKKYYKADFESVHKQIVDNLKQNEPGLYLLHGAPGTGKTTYIKYLSSLIQRDVIYIPVAFIDTLSDPSFLPILLRKKHSVLVIEDAEKALLARDPSDSSSLVSTVLNLTDGIMSNMFNIAIIATYNSNRQGIDKALLRKGRLKCEYEFDKLPTEQAQQILDENKSNYKATEPMSLADIFNVDQPDAPLAKELKEEKRMGFR